MSSQGTALVCYYKRNKLPFTHGQSFPLRDGKCNHILILPYTAWALVRKYFMSGCVCGDHPRSSPRLCTCTSPTERPSLFFQVYTQNAVSDLCPCMCAGNSLRTHGMWPSDLILCPTEVFRNICSASDQALQACVHACVQAAAKEHPKDPHAPKPNKTPFNFFSMDARQKAKQSYPELTQTEVTKKVTDKCSNFSKHASHIKKHHHASHIKKHHLGPCGIFDFLEMKLSWK